MIRFLTDEDFTYASYQGVRRRLPDLDIIRVQDAGLRTATDPVILEFAATDNRIVLSHDLKTMKTHALDRIDAAKPMPSLLLMPQSTTIARGIDAIIMVVECSQHDEWQNTIEHLPL